MKLKPEIPTALSALQHEVEKQIPIIGVAALGTSAVTRHSFLFQFAQKS